MWCPPWPEATVCECPSVSLSSKIKQGLVQSKVCNHWLANCSFNILEENWYNGSQIISICAYQTFVWMSAMTKGFQISFLFQVQGSFGAVWFQWTILHRNCYLEAPAVNSFRITPWQRFIRILIQAPDSFSNF